jgi:transposase
MSRAGMGSGVMVVHNCSLCMEKQRSIDELEDEVRSLRVALGREQRKTEDGFFGSSTPSSKKPFKKAAEKGEGKPEGARPGHEGHGRKGREQGTADGTEDIFPESETCPECGKLLLKKGIERRSVLDIPLARMDKISFNLHKRYCPDCRKSFTPQPPGVLPWSLFGNRLIAKAIAMHYLHGVPIERVCENLGIGSGSLAGIFQRCARLFADVPQKLVEEYREAPVKHPDETSWGANGKNGYVWLFATNELSIFRFGKNRSAQVSLAVFGKEALEGKLVVDRYNGYNKVPCEIQYCYAHLLRDVEDLEKEFPDNGEVSPCTAVVIPLLSSAIKLRKQPIDDGEFYAQAAHVRSEIQAAMDQPARHLGIRRIQDIFRNNKHRLYHWSEDRSVPADNNLAERDLRPTVIARKVSFGSVSDAGAQTRSTLMTVVTTQKKRSLDTAQQLTLALDMLARDPTQKAHPLLFPPPDQEKASQLSPLQKNQISDP